MDYSEAHQPAFQITHETTPSNVLLCGFFDGANAALVERGIDSPLGVGVFVTPVHAQAPDVEAAIRLVDAANDVYDLGATSAPLNSFAAEVRQYYAELADRLQESEPDLPDDRMYM
ncbi:hypothetical protein C453_14181 [Haloferax elongans ATCC BAA-1513]|uniref:Uncharacterized protein n=1 Tax=Haloferax elongans ATCC BAA-1513 TaxID=1230453 RepID=M0HF82_HALEO|nr:hypothetical protein C453_14181 [Haloferax elongans ATCC BAA-1513]